MSLRPRREDDAHRSPPAHRHEGGALDQATNTLSRRRSQRRLRLPGACDRLPYPTGWRRSSHAMGRVQTRSDAKDTPCSASFARDVGPTPFARSTASSHASGVARLSRSRSSRSKSRQARRSPSTRAFRFFASSSEVKPETSFSQSARRASGTWAVAARAPPPALPGLRYGARRSTPSRRARCAKRRASPSHLSEREVEHFVGPLAARHPDLHFVAHLFAEERARQWAGDADAPLRKSASSAPRMR